MLLLVSCNDYRKIEVSNVSINSVKIKSTTKATLEVKAEVKNPTKKSISLLNAEGMAKKEKEKSEQGRKTKCREWCPGVLISHSMET